MKLLVVDLQVCFLNPQVFSVGFAPNHVGTPNTVVKHVVYKILLLHDHFLLVFFNSNAQVQSLCLVYFN